MTSPIRIRDESGTALVEFAFVLPLLLVLILGIADFGRAFHYWIDSTHLANVTARYAAVNKNRARASLTLSSTWSCRPPQRSCARAAPSRRRSTLRFLSRRHGQRRRPREGRGEVHWSWLGYLVGHGLTSRHIKGSATMRLEAKPTNYSAGCA